MNTPDDSMTTAEELQHARDWEERINERIDEMLIDYDYLADAVIDTPVLTRIVTTIKRVSEQETTDGEIMARDVGMEAVIKAIRAALRPVAEIETDNATTDHELNRADRIRED